MPRQVLWCLVLIGTVVSIVGTARADVTKEQVLEAIDRGVSYLKNQQDRARGNWNPYTKPSQPGGVTALCALALLNSGVDPQDKSIQSALAYLRSLDKPSMTYSTALRTMVFCAAEPKKDRLLIRRHVQWLEKSQIKQGNKAGTWSYSGEGGGGDNSNTQFALLALYEAERIGIPVSRPTWQRTLNHWLRTQRHDGSWGYFQGPQAGRGSMTCAGIASVVIATGRLTRGDARVEDDRVLCCGMQQPNDAVERGLDWLGRNFSVRRNPGLGDGARGMWVLYYLYGVERVGRMTGRRFIGLHDWYREAADVLVSRQDRLSGFWKGRGPGESDPHVGTAFALLFLSKGRRPVLLAKLKHGPGEDWNRHRGDVANLTRYVESKWHRDLTWQVIDPRAAGPQDLLQAPVLFISGRDGLDLTPRQKENLRIYVNQGGFIFAEACCDGERFDRQFRRLMKELFPDSPLRLLPPQHPVWFAEEKVDPRNMRPLEGIDACCRTSVVYCPTDISCYWQLGGPERGEQYPAEIEEEIAACHAIGVNVLAYATNRELKEKLDVPRIMTSQGVDQPTTRGTVYVAKLQHGGGSDDAPSALSNLLEIVGGQLKIRVSSQRRLLAVPDESLFDYPIVFMHGRRNFRFSPIERRQLATYFERGGFLFADSICASPEFSRAFRREMKAIFPDQALERIPLEHPLFTEEFRGFDLSAVTRRDPLVRTADDPLRVSLTKVPPLLEGIALDGRYAVIFSPYDISCALENQSSLECQGYIRADAARIGVNVILYALQR